VAGGSAIASISWRILPLIGVGYLFSLMDRLNVSFAALQMNAELGFSATVYGMGAGAFYLAYALFEVPSNMLMTRVGARRWLARIMFTWGLLAAGMMLVRTPMQFYVMRFLLGMAEAGFFPGVIFYLSYWFPRAQRGRAISRFYFFGPISAIIMGPASAWLLGLHGNGGLSGWQWLFLVQGLPAAFVGIAIFLLLPDRPAAVSWLAQAEKEWIASELARDQKHAPSKHSSGLGAALSHPATLHLGMLGFLAIGAIVTYGLSAPLILKGAGFTTGQIGTLVAAGGLLGAAGMLLTGWFSDRRGERFTTMWISTTMMGLAFAMTATAGSPRMIAAADLLYGLSWGSVTLTQVSAWPDLLPGNLLALGCAGINTLQQIGAFVMPVLWGRMADESGNFRPGLLFLAAATVLALLMTLQLARKAKHSLAVV
jgi:ACS family tartrate transporter-like MFS transporter